MKTPLLTVPVLLFGACCSQHPAPVATAPAATAPAPAGTTMAVTEREPEVIPIAPAKFRTKTILHEIINGRLENIELDFTPTMREAHALDKIREAWTGLTAQLGEYQRLGEPEQTTEQGYTVVYVPLIFEKGMVRAKVVYDSTNYVAGFFFVP